MTRRGFIKRIGGIVVGGAVASYTPLLSNDRIATFEARDVEIFIGEDRIEPFTQFEDIIKLWETPLEDLGCKALRLNLDSHEIAARVVSDQLGIEATVTEVGRADFLKKPLTPGPK